MARHEKQFPPSGRRTLRERAGEILRTSQPDAPVTAPGDARATLLELQVHQIELELQNQDLRETQAELTEAHDRYADLFEFAPVAYITLDPNSRISKANLAAAFLLGIERHALLNTDFSKYVDRASQDAWYLHKRRALTEKTKQTCELDMRQAGGAPLVVRLETGVFGTGGDASCQIAMIDITKRKAAEEILRISEERLRLAAEVTGFGAYDFDRALGRLVWSPQLYAITGLSRSKTITKEHYLKLMHPEDRDTCGKRLEQALGSSAPCRHELEFRIVRPDGQVRWVRDTGLTFPAARQGSARTIGTVIDITEKKAYSEELRRLNDSLERHISEQTFEIRREQEFSEKILQAAQTIVLVLDTQGRIVRFNPYLEALGGWRLDEVRGKDWLETFVPETGRPAFRAALSRSLRNEGPAGDSGMLPGISTQGHTHPIKTREGAERIVSWSDAALTGADGQVQGLVCLGQDVTERKELERELLKIAAEEQRRIGHDLHDVLGQELTSAGLLAHTVEIQLRRAGLDGKVVEKLGQTIQRALQEVRAMARGLGSDRIGRLGLACALEELARTIGGEKVACRFECEGEVAVKDDEAATQLYRIAQEACANAVRHAQASEIVVKLASRGDGAELSVRDNGKGLPRVPNEAPGMGLRIMAYRADLIGAHLKIKALEAGGTLVRCLW